MTSNGGWGVRSRHRELLAAGKPHESGPFAGDPGMIPIDGAANAPEVEEMRVIDPSTPAGIIAGRTIREWTPGCWRASQPDR